MENRHPEINGQGDYKCLNYDICFQVIFDFNLYFDGITYCPFCGSSIEPENDKIYDE